VKEAPEGDKEGDSDEAKGCLGKVFYKCSNTTLEVN
jgi:hypothetical protein